MAGETKEQPKEQALGAVKATEVAQSMKGLRRAYYSRITEAHWEVELDGCTFQRIVQST